MAHTPHRGCTGVGRDAVARKPVLAVASFRHYSGDRSARRLSPQAVAAETLPLPMPNPRCIVLPALPCPAASTILLPLRCPVLPPPHTHTTHHHAAVGVWPVVRAGGAAQPAVATGCSTGCQAGGAGGPAQVPGGHRRQPGGSGLAISCSVDLHVVLSDRASLWPIQPAGTHSGALIRA
jgi:hypothetical protein